MANNKFFTIMVVPEKSDQVTKLVLPSYVFKGGILTLAFLLVLAVIMVLDYANVMNQINENKQLKIENRQLKQNVQVFKNKIVTIENTLDRVKIFATKLRIITNIEDSGFFTPPASIPMTLPEKKSGSGEAPVALPPGAPVVPVKPSTETSSGGEIDLEDAELSSTQLEPISVASNLKDVAPDFRPPEPRLALNPDRKKRQALLAALMTETAAGFTLNDADNSAFVQSEFQKLDEVYEEVNRFALSAEQETQHLLEKLGEKRNLLASTPTRIPTLGYITSEYGVRISPIDSRRKMHEGIDIANRFGADVIAPADGLVVFSGTKPGYGKIVMIDHGNGIETRFAHNSRLYVKENERIKRGQRIAAVGNTGHSTGPHCHYEVHANGLPVDPCWYILDQPGLCRSK